MKISNETKVGALTAIAITLLVLGFNFLKGKSLFKTGYYLYAKYADARGIMISNPVYIKGFPVGSVFDIESDEGLKSITVTIKMKSYYQIPVNSVASIKENPLSTSSISIALGDDKKLLGTGDTLITSDNPGLLNELSSKVMPIGDQIKMTLHSLDSVLKNVNTIFDPNTKHNLQETIANITKTTASLTVSAANIQAMLNEQNGAINQSMKNINSFTKNLSDNNDKITNTLSNLETTTGKLSKADMEGTVASLKKSVESLNAVLAKMNSKEGSMGLLMNDKDLYVNLNNTVRSANILLDDLKTHPKRYVNVSVFGKKDKSQPLTAPLNDSALKK